MNLTELRNEIFVHAQLVTGAVSQSERVGALLAIHELTAKALVEEAVVLPCQAEKETNI